MMRIALAGIVSLALCGLAHAQVFTADFSKSRQTIQGLGITATGTWNAEIAALYGKPEFAAQVGDDLGASVIRLALPPGMQAKEELDAGELNLSSFDFSVFDPPANLVKAVRAAHPEVKVILSIWSPPAWMKSNKSLVNGGSLRADRRAHFGKLCAAACLGFEQTYGVPVYALSIQNEPAFAQSYDSCVYTPEELKLAAGAVADAFTKWGVKTLIMGPEDVADTPRWLSFARELVEPSRGVSILNIHGFPNWPVNGAAGWTDLRKRMGMLTRPLWVTEISGEEPTWVGEGVGGGLFVAREIHEALVFGEVEGWVYWAITDPGATEFALMSRTTPTAKYFAAKQYFRHVRPGAVRVEVTPRDEKVLVSAFVDERSRRATVVLVNLGAEAEVELRLASFPGAAAEFAAYRSSADEEHAAIGAAAISDAGRVVLTLKGKSVTTLTAGYGAGPALWVRPE